MDIYIYAQRLPKRDEVTTTVAPCSEQSPHTHKNMNPHMHIYIYKLQAAETSAAEESENARTQTKAFTPVLLLLQRLPLPRLLFYLLKVVFPL